MADSATRTKMDQGNMVACLRKARHHLIPSSIGLMVAVGDFTPEEVKARNAMIDVELTEVQTRLKRIMHIAEANGYQDILDIFAEEFEYGHDLPQQ